MGPSGWRGRRGRDGADESEGERERESKRKNKNGGDIEWKAASTANNSEKQTGSWSRKKMKPEQRDG